MSAPLRTMVPQIRRLGSKFISARNFSSEAGGEHQKVSENDYKKAAVNIAKFAAAGFVGVTLTTWVQYKAKSNNQHLGIYDWQK